MSERGPKELNGKPDWTVMPFSELKSVLEVFEYGAKKYHEPFTYRLGIPQNELLAAIIRHAICIHEGKLIDEESGCYHAAHICAGGLMLISQYNKTASSNVYER